MRKASANRQSRRLSRQGGIAAGTKREVLTMSKTEPISGSPAAGSARQPDRRMAERTYTVFRVARLILPDGDQLGIVRNLSEHGIMLELHAETKVGNSVTLDLGEGHRLQGEVRWRNGAMIGLNFVEPIDVARVLDKKMADHESVDGKVPRLPRIKTDSPAEITHATRRTKARLVNISIGGACVETHAAIAPLDQIALTIPSLPTKLGTVRWRRGTLAGIVFDRPMSVQALMEWLAMRPKPDQVEAPERSGAVPRLTDERLADLYLISVDQLAMVVVANRDGTIVRANKRFQQYSGYSSDELVGMDFYALQPSRQSNKLRADIAETEVWRGELELVGGDGAAFRLNAMIVSAENRPDLLTCFMFEPSSPSRTETLRTADADEALVKRDARPALRSASQPAADAGHAIARPYEHRAPNLSRRELQVLHQVADGHSNEEIGANIGLSRRTVEIYRAKLLAKLGAPNTAAAILIACKKGIL